MKNYIGFKAVKAKPMTFGEFIRTVATVEDGAEIENEDNQGYKVVCSDGYASFSPKDVFEKAYMKVGDNNTTTQELVDSFIADIDVVQLGNKTTVVKATLVNGFIIVESSSCVDANNFSMQVGTDICMERIKNKLWELLGFILQTAVRGIKEQG